MGRGSSFKALDAAYKNLLAARNVPQSGKAMCYFGNAKGPEPSGCKRIRILIGKQIFFRFMAKG